jgi:phenylpropionate dioxygenase-like ring-hydroxylating dioxygenase large terminal subunit
MRYLYNCWYMAAWADEVSKGDMLSRKLLDQRIVFFRDSANRVQALRDRCPHRFAPLSKGRVEGDVILCGYHGLGFDGSGTCTLNPHGPLTRAHAVKSYPVQEAFRALWIWMGDPGKASRHLLPALGFVDAAPDTAFSKGYVAGKGHYQLWSDNIMDLTHADFLHPTTLGGGTFTRAKAKVSEYEGKVRIRWDCMNEEPTPLMRSMRDMTGKVDSWTEVEWSAPGIMTLRNGSVPTGTPRELGGSVLNLHIMTPESKDKTHYFFASTRDFAEDNADLNAMFARIRQEIFTTEDEPMIAAQYCAMEGEEFWTLKPALLRIDEGSILVRRRLDRMISEEEQQSPAIHPSDEAE